MKVEVRFFARCRDIVGRKHADLEIEELVRQMKKSEMGAIVTFLGVVRYDETLIDSRI